MHLVSAHVYKGLQTYIQMLDLSTGAIMIMTRERVKKLKELYICHLPPEIMEIVLMACAGNFNSVFNQHSRVVCKRKHAAARLIQSHFTAFLIRRYIKEARRRALGHYQAWPGLFWTVCIDQLAPPEPACLRNLVCNFFGLSIHANVPWLESFHNNVDGLIAYFNFHNRLG